MMAGTTRDGPVAGRLEGGSPPNRFLVALAVLTVLADAAEEQPLLLIIDDAQWLDRESAKVLAFLARRLYADAIACLFAVREPAEQKVPLDGLANLYVRCLQEAGSRELLLSLTGVPLDERVIDRIVAETGGNPLALAEVAGRWPLARWRAARCRPRRCRWAVGWRTGSCSGSGASRQAPRRCSCWRPPSRPGDPALLWRAAGHLGIDSAALRPLKRAAWLLSSRKLLPGIRWCAPRFTTGRLRLSGAGPTPPWRL